MSEKSVEEIINEIVQKFNELEELVKAKGKLTNVEALAVLHMFYSIEENIAFIKRVKIESKKEVKKE